MPFGVSNAGFELKRLQDILAEDRLRAVPIFQDLLLPGDILDTSDSSTLGRLINLFAPSSAVTWEQLQLVYSSFDPNTAVGIPLDNLVQYGGINRLPPSYSTVTALFTGSNGISIPSSSVIGSNSHPNTFITSGTVALTPIGASGITVDVDTVADNTDYTVTYSVSSVSNNTVEYTSGTGETLQDILDGLQTEINSAHPLLVVSIVGTSLVINKDNIFQTSTFSVSSNLVINSISKLGNLTSELVGDISAEANSLNVIKTPVFGWDSVTNPLAASEGRLTETDEELRLRFRNTKFERSSNIMDSLYSALLSLPSVESVAVYDNDTDSVDMNGLPAHSFTAVVLGGEAEDIANTIWRNKPVGITANGNTSVSIIDSQGFSRIINFEIPSPVTIYIKIDLDTDELFPADGSNQIKSAIIQYAKDNFSVGDDIVYSRLYTPINSVPGHSINSLFIGTSPSPAGTSNIPIAFDEIGSFESINIDIAV